MINRINALVDCLIDDPVWLILIGTAHFVITLIVLKLVDLADHALVGWLLLPGGVTIGLGAWLLDRPDNTQDRL